jgi:hypothetical protein
MEDRYSRAITSSRLRLEQHITGSDIETLIASGAVQQPLLRRPTASSPTTNSNSLAAMLYHLRVEYDRVDAQAIAQFQVSRAVLPVAYINVNAFLSPSLTITTLPSAHRMLQHYVQALERYAAGLSALLLASAHVKSLLPLRTALGHYVRAKGERSRLMLNEEQVEAVIEAVLEHFLNPRCMRCRGTKFKAVPNTHRLSSTPCPACSGTGVSPLLLPDVGSASFVRDLHDDLRRKMGAFDRNMGRYLRQ